MRINPGPRGRFDGTVGGRLSPLPAFGSNPGALSAGFRVPPGLAPGAPLVVVLHGCTQTADAYDRGSGWSRLADRCGFAVLYPEQARANNANTCFNWFQPGDTGRDEGEALSIRQMVEAMEARHRTDPARIFVTGLSAGGAMALAMLAAYPELFAGGAVIAGLPYRSAASVPEAFARMQGRGMPSPGELTQAVRSASGHQGKWPTLSVWQGSADRTVAPSNADAIAAQWRGVHALPASGAARLEADGRNSRKVWTNAQGRDVIELRTVAGMDHGTPIDAANGYGEAGPYMLDVGLSSTLEIARFWQIADAPAPAMHPTPSPKAPAGAVRQLVVDQPAARPRAPGTVESVINEALRKAGLLR